MVRCDADLDDGAMHHYFRLRFECQPGGSNRCERYLFGTLDEIKRAAAADLASPIGAYHALFYGEEILLECWEDGRQVASIDLHPYITYRLGDRDQPLTFAGPGDAPVLDMEEDEELMDQLLEGEVAIAVEIAWAAVVVPPLAGTALPPGTVASCAPPGDDEDPVPYGHQFLG